MLLVQCVDFCAVLVCLFCCEAPRVCALSVRCALVGMVSPPIRLYVDWSCGLLLFVYRAVQATECGCYVPTALSPLPYIRYGELR